MKFTVQQPGVPPGSYGAKFVEASPFSNDFGEAVKLVFEITTGEHQGSNATRICSTKLTPNSNLFTFITALLGHKPGSGEEIDLEHLAGTPGMIVVGETKSGSTRVESFVRVG